jgi:hypothetical protein
MRFDRNIVAGRSIDGAVAISARALIKRVDKRAPCGGNRPPKRPKRYTSPCLRTGLGEPVYDVARFGRLMWHFDIFCRRARHRVGLLRPYANEELRRLPN